MLLLMKMVVADEDHEGESYRSWMKVHCKELY
jgi:hypothetical protein